MLLAAAPLFFFPHYYFTQGQSSYYSLVTANKGSAYLTYYDWSGGFDARPIPRLTRVDPDGRVIYRVAIDCCNLVGAADDQGNLYASNPGFRQSSAIKFDPAGNVVYSIPLPVSYAYAPAVGRDGSAYFIGYATPGPGYPAHTTPGAWVTDARAAPNQTNALVFKVSPSGKIIYSTFLNNAPPTPIPPQGRPEVYSTAGAIAVDASGSAYVWGFTNDPGFPVTAGAFQSQCDCPNYNGTHYILKLSPGGDHLEYATYFGGSGIPVASAPMTVDAAGHVQIITNEGAKVRIRILSSDGASLISDRSLTLDRSLPPNFWSSAQPDGQGNLMLWGSASGSNPPPTDGGFRIGGTFVTVMRISDGAILYSTRLPSAGWGTSDIIVMPDGDEGFIALGDLEFGGFSLTRFVPDTGSRPAILGVSNAARKALFSDAIARGEIVDVYGTNLGPPGEFAAKFDASGHLPFNIGGTEVYFGLTRAPLLSVSDQRITAIVPFHIFAAGAFAIQVRRFAGQMSNTIMLSETASDAQLILGNDGNYAAALNQDGTVNSADHPIGSGGVVSIFVNGAGPLSPVPDDGTPGTSEQKLSLPVSATVGLSTGRHTGCSCPTEVLYAGAAPGLVGVSQINLLLPPAPVPLQSAVLSITIGDRTSWTYLWVGQK